MVQAEVIGTIDVANGVGEGPCWDDRSRMLYWVDITGRSVLRLVLDSLSITRWSMPDFPAFIVLRERHGAVVGLRDTIMRVELPPTTFAPLCQLEPDRPANRVNEGKVDPSGRLWIGTMQDNLNPDGSERTITAATGALYRIEDDGSFARVLDGIGLSNTLAWVDDGRTMYFGDSGANRIRRYRLDSHGDVTATEEFHAAPPAGVCDGSAIDAEGYLWNARFAAGRLVRFAPDGRVDCEIGLPVSNPTSCCFGGSDLRSLFVTSARFAVPAERLSANPREGALVVLRTAVTGTPSMRYAG